jgi:hypothetical protein
VAPRAGIVSLAALDVRVRPDHRAELGSQLLLGETVRVLGSREGGRWLEVRGIADGYRGWARSWGIVATSPAGAARWGRRATGRVSALFLEAREPGRGGALVTPLFWGSRVIPIRSSGPRQAIRLPDGRIAVVPRAGLERPGRSMRIERRVRSLLGTPYLWGGRTPLGFDCSGFTQLVLAEQGIEVPRDARDQFTRSRPVPAGARPVLGDLGFFGRPGEPVGHVGIALGKGLYAHARACTRISSIESSNPLYDRELAAQFRGWRRP